MRISFLSILLFWAACSSSSKETFKPIPPQKMAELMAEIAIVDGTINLANTYQASDSINPTELYSQVLKKYDISRQTLDSNLNYYSENYLEFDKVLDSSLVEIAKRRK
jgi:hypothetical protein